MTRRLLTTTALATLLLAAPALAETSVPARKAADPDVAGAEAASAVDGVVVTATRFAQRADKIGVSITALDARDIALSQATNVADLISRTPGVVVARSGGEGQQASVFIRGAESYHTVVVVDGVKLNDPSSTQGGFNFGNLLIGDIARIEVLRGAQSTLWGSQAIGGVVNLITVDPTAPLERTLQLEAGSNNTARLQAGLGGRLERLSWRLAGGYASSEGVSAAASGVEDDGYTNANLSGRTRLEITNDVSLDLRGVYTSSRTEYDAGFASTPPYALSDDGHFDRTQTGVAYAGLNVRMLDGRLKNRLAYGRTNIERTTFDPALATPEDFATVGRNLRWEYQGTLQLDGGWNAVFGAERETSDMRTASPYGNEHGESRTDSLYGQIQAEPLSGLTVTGGLRRDDHQAYGAKSLGQVAAVWALNDGSTLVRASWGQGFRAPGLYELYSQYGNRTLRPETSESWETGVEQKLGDRASLTATYFERRNEDEIGFFSCPFVNTNALCKVNGVTRYGYYENISRTKAKGVELFGFARLADDLTLTGNVTWTDATNQSPGANLGKRLPRRPENTANLSARYLWAGTLNTSVAVRYVGERFDTLANATPALAAYTVIDLLASYPIRDGIEVYGRIENLTDEAYSTARSYSAAGRGAFFGMRAKF